MLFLERSGYPEETYHTFSYSPLTDDDGRIAGMLCVVSEDTERVIGERRMATLRDLGSDPTTVRSVPDVIAAAARHLEGNLASLPFTLTYLFDADGTTARLAGTTGMPPGHPAAPLVLERGAKDPVWPVDDLVEGISTVVGLEGRFPDLPTGAWELPPQQGLVVPLPQQGSAHPYGFFVAGVNRHRPLDAGYRAFVHLVAGQLAASIGSARAYETERERAESLAELDRAKTTFFTNVSHELRTPLTLLLGPAEDALADDEAALPASQRPRVEVIHRNAERLLKLVNTLLDFSRLQGDQAGAHREPVDLAAYTAELASMFDSAVTRAGLTLSIQCPSLPDAVPVDREMWAKIVLNLVSNALKFTFEGEISVRVDAEDGFARLVVADTGIGIAPADQATLFERFHRVSDARSRSHEGSGIGLALVAELAALHGGDASVESTPGAGSRFTVRVPLRAEAVEADAAADGNVPAERYAASFVAEAMRWLESEDGDVPADAQDRPRILVADDNADMRTYVASLLSERYVVETAGDGAIALEKARAHPPDLVLTDVMMPNLDGFGLLAALHADDDLADIPVVMLSARADEEGTVEGLEAGADDYLVKPFAARELLARVHANLELERVRRTRDQLHRSQGLLDQAQRLAAVGSWEIDVASGSVAGSEEFLRQIELSAEELAEQGIERAIAARVHPDDAERLRATLAAAVGGAPFDLEFRLVGRDGAVRSYRALGELERDADGTPLRLRGSNQDITEQRAAEQAIAAVAAAREAAARERQIADELQRSLLPALGFDPAHLDVGTFYQPGVEGTQVGGDWYDVIELGAGRTALVVGDVMGRGVPAAAIMAQLRATVRAFARLDLPPADVLEHLDGAVRDLGEDQIVTCVYAVYDPRDRSLSFANAGHLPPLLAVPGEPPRRLTDEGGPPLGAGPAAMSEARVVLPVGARLALYTDGLVERRGSDIDTGIDRLADQLAAARGPAAGAPAQMVAALVPAAEDDIALLVACVAEEIDELTAVHAVAPDPAAVQGARRFVTGMLGEWGVSAALTGDAVLLVSELVSNAILHGRPPIELRMRRTAEHLLIEVDDGATVLPRKLRPTPDDEHGRGLVLAALLADKWGTRSLRDGKSVWCLFSLERYAAGDAPPA
jgi:signal transduction histidine kinase/DNA-binding response OmpR family regulator